MNSAMYGPKVSVIMPAYNAGTYIRQALDSVLNQSLTGFELIAVDDGSTDNTMSVLDEFGNRFGLSHKKTAENLPGRLIEGIRAAAGQYIAFFDSEDIMHPLQLQNSITILDYAPGIFLCFSNLVLIVILRKSNIEELGMFDETLLRGDDFKLWLRFARSMHDIQFLH